MIALGSPAFQHILKECTEKGIITQVLIEPKGNLETLLKEKFTESPPKHQNLDSNSCDLVNYGQTHVDCRHRINNARILSIKATKNEPARFFQFYFLVSFQNKLRPKNEEMITIMVDESYSVTRTDNSFETFLGKEDVEITDFRRRLATPWSSDNLKAAALKKLNSIVEDKLVLFDLPIDKERKSKLKKFEKRLRRERLEQVISSKYDFDPQKWQSSLETLLEKEKDSFLTRVAVKLINLAIVNTTKVAFEAKLDNNSSIRSSLILGIDHSPKVTCPLCKNPHSEGYATEDSLYVCGRCIRQSLDTGKVFSKKAALRLDETLKEYIEPEEGFVCSVCGRKHSKLLEFKCSYDDSSVCIFHYDICDLCGKVFSRLNLSHTDGFERQLCPEHAAQRKLRER